MQSHANELYSSEELEWIRHNPVIKVGVTPDWRPIEYIEGGEFKGLGAEFIKAIARRTGLKFETHAMDWASGREALTSRQIDVLPTYARPLGRTELSGVIKSTDPYFITSTAIIAKADTPVIYDPRKLNGKLIAIKGGGAYERQFKALYPEVKLLPVDTAEESLAKVISGEADAAVGVDAVLIPLMHRRYYNALHVAGVVTGMPAIMRMGVHPDNRILLSILNKSLSSMTAVESERIVEHWFRTTNYGQPSWRVILSFYFWELVGALALFVTFAGLVYQAWISRRKAQRSERDKAMFLAVMSHEIRTPMNVILSTVELLERASLPSKEAALARVAASGANNLLSLLDDVLDFSKMEAGKIVLQVMPTDVAELSRDILSTFELRAEEKGLQLELVLKLQSGLWPVVDPTRLRQILTNLLSNAIKFTEAGRVVLTVELLADPYSEAQGELLVSVTDTGIGISNKQQTRLFHAFAQADESTTRKYGGTGLGLRICKDLTHLMSGSLSVASEPGKGSTFTLRIPVALQAPAQVAEPLAAVPAKHAETSGLQILVVEDHASNRFVIECQLRELGYSPTLVEHGLEALDLVTEKRFDLILLDCNLLDIDGYALVGMLRTIKVENDAYIPIIAISATVGAEHVNRCFESGFDGVLSKPLRLEELRETIEQWTMTDSNAEVSVAAAPAVDYQQEMHQRMLTSIQDDLAAVITAVQACDRASIQRSAHRMVGAVLYAGWNDVAQQARLIEQGAQSQPFAELTVQSRVLEERVASRT